MQTFDKTLKIQQVIQITGLSRTAITQKINAGTFPKPFKRNAWLKSHIDDWLQNQKVHQQGFKKLDSQKIENVLRRVMLLIQIGQFVYFYFTSEITTFHETNVHSVITTITRLLLKLSGHV